MEEDTPQTGPNLSLPPPEVDPDLPDNVRLERLVDTFLDISQAQAGQVLKDPSLWYMQHGDGIRLCLNEILELTGPTPEDLHLDNLRQEYIQTLFVKSKLLSPEERAAEDAYSDLAQQEYTDAVVDKIARVINAHTPKEALEVGQLPPLVRKASFNQGEEIDMQQFTANHLYLLVDTALKEHIKRRQLIDHHQTESRLTRITSNRGARVAIGGAIGVLSLVPELSFIPKPDEVITQDGELGLRVVSGAIIFINFPEFVRLTYLARKNERKDQQHYDNLSDSQYCDWALRMVYGSTRRGGSSKANAVTGRFATEDKKQNRRLLEEMQKDFPHLNNDPGGKPYTARQALGYAARLLLDRRKQLDAIIDPAKPAAQQQELYLQLCKEIMLEDVRRMKKGLNVTRIRRIAMGGLGIIPALLFPSEAAAVSGAAGLGKDTADVIGPRPDDPED